MPERVLAGACADGSERVANVRARAPRTVTQAIDPGATVLTPDVLGARLWREIERGFLYADRVLASALPERYNPLLHSGAIAMLALVVALVSGVLLLFWYRPSLNMAWPSVAAMGQQPWGAGLVRSLHRYSSDVAIAATIVHTVRLISERRFTGPRWLAWVTGTAVVGLTWFVGWTGYWLVWDTRAHANTTVGVSPAAIASRTQASARRISGTLEKPIRSVPKPSHEAEQMPHPTHLAGSTSAWSRYFCGPTTRGTIVIALYGQSVTHVSQAVQRAA